VTDLTETADPTDFLLHDLRRFLHNAHDHQDALNKISKAMTRSTGLMREQEGTVKRILQRLQKQIDAGVAVHIDADLKAHVVKVANVTAPLVNELQRAANATRNFAMMIAMVTFAAGLSGAFLGVFAALRLL